MWWGKYNGGQRPHANGGVGRPLEKYLCNRRASQEWYCESQHAPIYKREQECTKLTGPSKSNRRKRDERPWPEFKRTD